MCFHIGSELQDGVEHAINPPERSWAWARGLRDWDPDCLMHLAMLDMRFLHSSRFLDVPVDRMRAFFSFLFHCTSSNYKTL